MKPLISIVTGTLNRCEHLKQVIANTVDADERLELVLVDGGSSDETLPYLKSLAHPRITLIAYGKRSPYPHFMNLGVRAARAELVCQWNDDVFLVNPWEDVFKILDDHQVYIFAWKEDNYPKFKNKKWILTNTIKPDGTGEIVVNYGMYHKDVFRRFGLYNPRYDFYCADGDMAHRAFYGGAAIKSCPSIKAVALAKITKYNEDKVATDFIRYKEFLELYRRGIFPDYIPHLDDTTSTGHHPR